MVEKETIVDLKIGMSDNQYEAYYNGYMDGYRAGIKDYDELLRRENDYAEKDMLALKELQEMM